MKYRTRVRELEAIRFDGTNRDEINKLTGLQFEVMETMTPLFGGVFLYPNTNLDT